MNNETNLISKTTNLVCVMSLKRATRNGAQLLVTTLFMALASYVNLIRSNTLQRDFEVFEICADISPHNVYFSGRIENA